MRYLFFDIEAADGNFKICEFGLVICDSNMKPTHKKLYLINPKGKFNLTGRKDQRDLHLSFTEEQYKASPEFDDVYDNIKFALEQKDIMILGHSVNNDIRFLDKACNRYRLPKIKYVAYDVQKMFSYFSKERTKFAALENVVEELIPLEERQNLIDHRSVDDAYMTMLIFRAMIRELNVTPEQMIELCEGCKYDSIEYIKELEAKERAKNERAHAKALLRKSGIKDEKGLGWELYREEARKTEGHELDSDIIGKRYAVANRLKDEPDVLEKVIDKIKENNVYLVISMKNCDYLIVFDEENKNAIQATLRREPTFKIITVEEFLK